MKKSQKIIGRSLLGIIAFAYIFFYIAFNGYKPGKIKQSASEEALSYFNETYEDCRSEFLIAAKQLQDNYSSVEISKIPVTSETGQELFIDIAYLPAKDTTINLLILTSGLHGVEGFTGSAIQLMTINEIIRPDLLNETGILLVHGINPYGFKNIRKVSENNVDLNRNCAIEKSLYNSKNEGYGELVDMLGPTKLANHANSRNRNFHIIAIQKIIVKSMAALKKAALEGQYEYPKGIYYGGQKLEPQISNLAPILKNVMSDYSKILTVDLHTGYAKNGELSLFQNPVDDPVVKEGLENIFIGDSIDWGDTEDFYIILGSFTEWVGSLTSDKLYFPMVFEFGTLDSKKTLGSITSIQNMILENQGHHYGYKNDKAEIKIKKRFREMYYPSSPEWRSKVILDSKVMLEKVFERLPKI